MGTKVTGEIPAYVSSSDKGIFDYSPNLTWTRNCFNGCSGITGPIPENIFKYNTALIRVDGTFAGCSGIGSTPDRRAQIPQSHACARNLRRRHKDLHQLFPCPHYRRRH